MEILKYRTSIQSIEDEQRIISLLNKEAALHRWNIDKANGETILTISGN